MDVARRCAVSQSTVSRVLNNSKQGRFSVSPEVRQRILDAARELNYRPSFAARNLAASKTKLVAVLGFAGIWSDRVGPDEEAVGTLAGALGKAGYEICLQFFKEGQGHFEPPPLRVDGVVAFGAADLDELDELEKSGIPYVSINGAVGARGSLVAPDDAGGTALALQHLAELGHRRVAYLDHPSDEANHPSVFERRAAFKKVAAKLNLEVPKLEGVPVLTGSEAWDGYFAPFVQAAVVKGGATAVLSYSHFGALSLMRAAHEAGLAAPRDFSLVCFNNAPVLKLFVPSVTAVDVPAVQMGNAAAELLLAQMSSDEKVEPRRVRVPESIVVRESSAPPPAHRASPR